MELRDYVRMLKRGWPTVVLFTALLVGLASLYLAVTPKHYEAGTTLFVSADDPQSITDLQQGSTFATSAVATYAKIIDSTTVLGPVAAELRPQRDVNDLVESVTVAAPESTTLIEIVAAGDDPDDVATVANAVAVSATRVLPTLQSGPDGRPLVRVQQTRPAAKPTTAVSPNAKRVLALGLILGLCLGLATTITSQSLDTRLRQVDDLRAITDVPLVAALPQQKRAQRQGLAVRDDPAGVVGEAYRTLRTNLRFLEAKDRHSLVFTAVTDDRDGAQVPANLAWSLVQAGWRVLLVDLDLRRTTVGDAFSIRGGTGLADVLMGQADLPEVVRDTTHPRLKVVTAGTPQASPADLLSAPAMADVLRRMEKSHDYVILHAPPLLSSTDAALVAGVAGGTLLTVAAGRTRAQDLTTALGVLTNVRVTPLGLVLTGARTPDRPGRSSARTAPRPPVPVRSGTNGARPQASNGTRPNGAGTRPTGAHGAATRPAPGFTPVRTAPNGAPPGPMAPNGVPTVANGTPASNGTPSGPATPDTPVPPSAATPSDEAARPRRSRPRPLPNLERPDASDDPWRP